MTVYTDEVNIYNPDAIQDAIDEAGDAYKSVITEVGSTGVKIHPSGQSGAGIVDYTQIDDTGMEVFVDGDSVADFGEVSTIGNTESNYTQIDRFGISEVDEDSHQFFFAKDMRKYDDTTGIFAETFIASSANQRTYTLTLDLYNIALVYFDDVEVSPSNTSFYNAITYNSSSNSVTLPSGYTTISAGTKVCIAYYTDDTSFKALRFGTIPDSNPGPLSASFGELADAKGRASFAEGSYTTAEGNFSHAEGRGCFASGTSSHAEGDYTWAGPAAHAEGASTSASGTGSHAQNSHTIAGYTAQTAIGKYNDNQSTNAFEIGNGTSTSNRSNAFEVNWDGDVAAAGDLALAGDALIGGDITMAGDILDMNGNQKVGAFLETDISSNKSCANGAYTAVGSISLSAGVWVITAGINYAGAAGGWRLCSISTSSGTTAPSAAELRQCTEYRMQGSDANNSRISVTKIAQISSAATYYLKAWQNSGNAINATGNIRAVRIA